MLRMAMGLGQNFSIGPGIARTALDEDTLPVSAMLCERTMRKLWMRAICAAQKRLPTYSVWIFVVWPLATFILAIYAAMHIPYYSLQLGQAALGVLGGLTILGGDILLVCLIVLAGSLSVFSLLEAANCLKEKKSRQDYEIEVLSLFMAVLFSTVILYPSVLSCSLFSFFQAATVWGVLAVIVCLVAMMAIYRGRSGRKWVLVPCLLATGILPPGLTLLRNQMPPRVPDKAAVVFLGIDSISLVDDMANLQHWIATKSGKWYTNVVSPGLLTNAVWPSILLQEPVHEHGIFHAFQDPRNPAVHDLVRMAKEQGYYTVSFFSDQVTCWVGSSFPFDEDCSGPLGWRQLAANIVENNSILLPLFKPWLPVLPWTSVPPNHAGAYPYSIKRELNEIFSQSRPGQKTMVIGHTTYLHLPNYPNILEMPWSSYKRVLVSPLYCVQDRSFDWQDTTRPYDTIPLREWKVQYIQKSLIKAIERTQFLQHGGKLLVFSDHGDRVGISQSTFNKQRYWNVLFATVNLPPYDDKNPISSLDCGAILGLTHNKPFPAVVEYANGNGAEWSALGLSAKLSWDGAVHLNKPLLALIFQRLQSYKPQLGLFAHRQ